MLYISKELESDWGINAFTQGNWRVYNQSNAHIFHCKIQKHQIAVDLKIRQRHLPTLLFWMHGVLV
jgi:hypothetical protein